MALGRKSGLNTVSLVRMSGGLVVGLVGLVIGSALSDEFSGERLWWLPPFTVGGAILGTLGAQPVVLGMGRKMVAELGELPMSTLVTGGIGLMLGLLASALVAIPLSNLPDAAGDWLPLLATIFLSVTGVAVVLSREREVRSLLGMESPEAFPVSARSNGRASHRVLLDTSAIIDGRVADIGETGFLRDTLIVPQFILDELRHIADSSDALKRTRGRRGLEVLTRLRQGSEIALQVTDDSAGDGQVDTKLVTLARDMHASILTTDFNLKRVAEFQGIKVLNVNDLANALRPVLLPGDEMQIQIVQEGKEAGQGLGFLDDGTMVVVEAAREFLESEIAITVTRVLQTSAGRIIFAQPKAS